MPTKDSMQNMVASQMMRCGKRGRLAFSESVKNSFIKRHRKQIDWAVENLPRSSAALHAVVVKCLIAYKDHGRVMLLAKALKHSTFNGFNDPAYLLYKYLQSNSGAYDFATVYGNCVTACRAYMENKQLQKLKPSQDDIFEWDEDYTVPDGLLENWDPDKVPESAALSLQS